MEMLREKYHFRCRFETEGLLPPYKGSAFRGVFGHALKRVVCAVRQPECRDCLLTWYAGLGDKVLLIRYLSGRETSSR
jgi:hypothetical protein